MNRETRASLKRIGWLAAIAVLTGSAATAMAAPNTMPLRAPREPGTDLLYYLNVYPEDVLRGTRGQPNFDPVYEEALAYGARALSHNTNLQPKKENQP